MTSKIFVLSFMLSVAGQLIQTNYLPPNSYIADVKCTIQTQFVTNGVGYATGSNTIALKGTNGTICAATSFTAATAKGAPVTMTILSNASIKSDRRPMPVIVTLDKAVDASNTTSAGSIIVTIFGVQR